MTTLHLTHGPAYAVAEISALASVDTFEEVLRSISEQTQKRGDRRLLANLMDVVGTLGPDEHRTIGLLVFRHLSHLEKVASLVPPGKITRVSERAARAEGMDLRVFTNFAEAVDWLLS